LLVNIGYSQSYEFTLKNDFEDGIYLIVNKKNCGQCEYETIKFLKELKNKKKDFPLYCVTLIDTANSLNEKHIANNKYSFCDSIIFFLCAVEDVYFYNIINYNEYNILMQEAVKPSPRVVFINNQIIEIYQSDFIISNYKVSKQFKKTIKKHIRKWF